MLPEIENLLHLQEADKEIQRLKDEVAALPKRVAAIEEKLAGTKARLERSKAAVKGDEASRRKYESAIQDLQQKISKYRDQSLDVKTNEQYKALLHEIQFAEQEIRINEDKILELMVNVESREKDVRAAEAELKEEAAEIEKEKRVARERTAEDEKQLAEWNSKREAMRAGVNADLLRQYERVSRFRGTGIAEVRDHKCMGCQVMLRPQTYNEVRSGHEIVVCDSCQRVLYFNPANNQPLEEKSAVVARRRRARPKSDAPQAWYHRSHFADHGEVFLCFLNGSDHTSSRRVYEAGVGRRIGDILVREGKYSLAFPEDIASAIRLNGTWQESEIDEWGDELPMIVLDALQRDLQAAHADGIVEPPAAETEVPSEQTAANQ